MRAALDAFKPDFVADLGRRPVRELQGRRRAALLRQRLRRFKFTVAAGQCLGRADRRTIELPGHRAARQACWPRGLIEDGFDTAYAYKPLHHPLGHAFTNAILYLDYDRTGFPYPIVPFAINCYGRKVLAQRGGLPTFDRELDGGRPRSAGADAAAAVRSGRGDRPDPGANRPGAWRCWPRRAGRMPS